MLTFFWLTFAFFGFILALAGLSALQNYIYKDDNVTGAARTKYDIVAALNCLHWCGRLALQ